MIKEEILAKVVREYLGSGELQNVLVGSSVDRINSTDSRLQDWSLSTARLVLNAITWHNDTKDADIIKVSQKQRHAAPNGKPEVKAKR